MTEYTIQAGQQNFSPGESVWPTLKDEFEFWVAFHHSCYYSLEEWGGDRDWKDANKAKMLSLAYTWNNHMAYGAGWMPGDTHNEILVTPYTNYPGTDFQTNRKDSISTPTYNSWEQAKADNGLIHGLVTRNSRNVYYTFSRQDATIHVRHDYRLSWWMFPLFREVGTSFGGADNSPGKYGGKAHKDMKMWMDVRYR